MPLSLHIPTRYPSLMIVHFNHYQNFSGKDAAFLDFGENLEQLLQACSRLTDPCKTIGLHLQSPALEPFATGIITSQRAWNMFVDTLVASSPEVGSTTPSFIAAVQPVDSEIEERASMMHLGVLGRRGSRGSRESVFSESFSSFSVARPGGTPSSSPTPSLSPPLSPTPIAEETEAARKRQVEGRLAEQHRQRELERAAAVKEAHKQAQQEVEERARLRAQAKMSVPAVSGWRARTQAHVAPARAQSPAPAELPASATGLPKIAGASGGWRQRFLAVEKDRQAAGAVPAVTSSPTQTIGPLPKTKKDVDGFEMVPENKVWRPKQLQNQAERKK